MMFNVNEKITTSEDTEANAFDVFKKAVNNGQTRLALEALVDVIDSIIDFITSDSEEEALDLSPENKVALEIKEEKVEPANADVSAPAKKKTKEITTPTSS